VIGTTTRLPDDPPIDELAYEQVSRALDQQAGVLNELRQRTSTLVAVTALVATFLGGQAVRAPHGDEGPGGLLVAALVSLLLGVAACLLVLSPTRMRARRDGPPTPPHPEEVVALSFTLNVEVMLDHAEERGLTVPDTTRLHAARSLQRAWDENSSIIGGKQRVFLWSCAALLAQTASWITFIALGRG